MIGKVDQTAAQVLVRGGITWDDGFAFFARYKDRTIDLESLRRNAERMEDFISKKQSAIGSDKKTFLLGFSNGAILAAALILRGRLRLEGAVLFRPLAPDLELNEGKSPKCPVLILEGTKDPRRHPTDATQLTLKLRQAGLPASQWATPCGHGPEETEFRIVRRWLRDIIAT